MMVFGLALTLLNLGPVPTRDDGQWTNQPPEIRRWFRSVKRPDDPTGLASCCGEGDAFDAEMMGEAHGEYIVRIINGRGLVPDGQIVIVPLAKLQPNFGNPLDKIILFLDSALHSPLCLIPKVGA